MKTVELGATGQWVSAACLGAMRMGSTTDKAASYAILDLYAEAGGGFIDTANVYQAWAPGCKGGESESLLAAWMRDRGNRDRVFLATKFGSRFQRSGFGLRPAQMREELEASLGRLGTDHVDLLYAHFDDRGTPMEETLATFAEFVRAGKARFVGASNFRAWRLEAGRQVCAARDWPFYCCVQQRYSFLQPGVNAGFGMQVAANEDLVEYCRERRLTLLAYSPLLGGTYGRSDRPSSDPYDTAANARRREVVRAMAGERGVSGNQLVLAWLLHHTPPVVPIFSASTVEQIRENIAALDVSLTAAEMERLDKAGAPVPVRR